MNSPIAVAWDELTFGQRLRTLREGRGWSLARLAAQIPCSKSYLHDLEHDRHVPSAELLLDFSRLFDVRMGWLYVGEMDA